MEKEEKTETRPRAGIVNLEKRKHPRFSVDLPIEYHRMTSPTQLAGRAENASEGGLLVYLPEQVEIGQYLKIKIFFASGSRLDTIELSTEVVWTDFHPGKNWGDYRSGVKFLDISPEDLEKFGGFLKSLSE